MDILVISLYTQYIKDKSQSKVEINLFRNTP